MESPFKEYRICAEGLALMRLVSVAASDADN
jgi:hypothetical protein